MYCSEYDYTRINCTLTVYTHNIFRKDERCLFNMSNRQEKAEIVEVVYGKGECLINCYPLRGRPAIGASGQHCLVPIRLALRSL